MSYERNYKLPIINITNKDDFLTKNIKQGQLIHYACKKCNKEVLIHFWERNLHIYKRLLCRDCACVETRKNNNPDIGQKISKSLKTYFSNEDNKNRTIKQRTETYKQKTGYECPFKNPEVRSIYKRKTGYDNPSQNPDVKKRKVKTFNAHFGKDYYFQTDEFVTYNKQYKKDHPELLESWKNKIKSQNNGIYFVQTNEFKEKSKKSKLDKYNDPFYTNYKKSFNTYKQKTGYECPFKNPEVISKGRETYFMHTGYDHPSKNPNINWGRQLYNYYGECFDSLWEMLVYIYCIEHYIPIIREPCSFEFFDMYGNVKHYKPDFMICGRLVEIKGDQYMSKNKDDINFIYRRHSDGRKLTRKEIIYFTDLYTRKYQCAIDKNVVFWVKEDLMRMGIFEYFKYKFYRNFKNVVDSFRVHPKYEKTEPNQKTKGYTPYNIDKTKIYQDPLIYNSKTPYSK